MGGQACVFYGAAEFSRDCDIVVVSEQSNFNRLTSALKELDADLHRGATNGLVKF